MDKAAVEALKKDFSRYGREHFFELNQALFTLAQKTYLGETQFDWLALNLEEALKGFVLRGDLSFQHCPDAKSILARLNRFAGEKIADLQRGAWRFEKLPPVCLLYEESASVELDAQYALMQSLHRLLDQWEKNHPKQSIALEMYYWGGFNYAEIGKSLDVSDWTARNWVQQGEAHVRKGLERRVLRSGKTVHGANIARRE